MYLRRRLNDTFERRDIQVITVDEPTCVKAFTLSQFV